MRRVVVTPTFAAGLGVVIAAILAYPMTRTVISYGAAPPAGGHRCPVQDCVGDTPGDGGTLASAKPDQRLGRHPARGQGADPDAAPASGQAAGAGTGPQPVMQFQTLRQLLGGFIGQITIISPTPVPAHWQLRLSYGSGRIIGVLGGRSRPSSGHAVLVTPDAGNGSSFRGGDGEGGGDVHFGGTGGEGDSGGTGGSSTRGGAAADDVQIVVVVSGTSPRPPSGCAFDGHPCRVG